MIRHCIRAVAIGLIIFPEPVTTAVGIAILSATMAFPRYKRLESFENIEELICRSFKIPETRRFGRHLPEDKPLVFHEFNRKSTEHRVEAPGVSDGNKSVHRKISKKLPAEPSSTAKNHPRAVVNLAQKPSAGKLPLKVVSLEASALANNTANKWFDNRRVPEKVLHHTLKTSLPQYEKTKKI